jgi:hypothetical protein
MTYKDLTLGQKDNYETGYNWLLENETGPGWFNRKTGKVGTATPTKGKGKDWFKLTAHRLQGWEKFETAFCKWLANKK